MSAIDVRSSEAEMIIGQLEVADAESRLRQEGRKAPFLGWGGRGRGRGMVCKEGGLQLQSRRRRRRRRRRDASLSAKFRQFRLKLETLKQKFRSLPNRRG